MRLLAHDVADAAFALEELMFARKRDRSDAHVFVVMLTGLERARAALDANIDPPQSLVEELVDQTQAALDLVHLESARNARRTQLATLELQALMESLREHLGLSEESADTVARDGEVAAWAAPCGR